MKLLELFAGTGSVGNVATTLGFEVVSLDRDMDASIRMDIMDWDYLSSSYAPGHFDLIWASPPCTEYSIAKTIGIRDIEGANKIVRRTLDIIDYFRPRWWIVENPQTGLLKHQAMMADLRFVDVDYCKYGMQYRKRTRLWNNVVDWTPRPLCKRDCSSMNSTLTRHLQSAQRGPTKGQPDNRHKQTELYVVPNTLVTEILVKLIIIDLTG